MKFIQITIPILTLIALATINVEANAACSFCQKVAQQLKDRLTDDVIATTEKTMMEQCERIPSEEKKQQCKEGVEMFIEGAKFLKTHSPKEMCQKVGACPKDIAYLRQLIGNRKNLRDIEKLRDGMLANYQKQMGSLLQTRARSPVACETCIMVVGQVQELIQMPHVQNTIYKAIEVVCERVAGNKKQDCIDESKAYVNELIKFIREQDPKAICAMLGECVAESKEKFFERLTESVICDECKKAVDKFKPKVQDKDVREQVENLLNQVCQQFPDDSMRQQCQEFTSQMVEKVIDFVEGMTSTEVCQAVRLC